MSDGGIGTHVKKSLEILNKCVLSVTLKEQAEVINWLIKLYFWTVKILAKNANLQVTYLSLLQYY